MSDQMLLDLSHLENLKALPPKLRDQTYQALSDPVKFMRLLRIARKSDGKLIPFEPTKEQIRLIRTIQKNRRVVIVKARQLGVSTVLRGFSLWKTYTSKFALKYGVISYHDNSSKEMRDVDKIMYDSLPKHLHRELEVDNTKTTQFEDTKARLSSFTAGSKYGTRSFVLQGAHVTEFAYYKDANKLLTALDATVGDQGDLWVESTAEKAGDTFHRLAAGAPDNGWTLFVSWWWAHDQYKLDAPPNFVPTKSEVQEMNKYNLTYDQLYWRRVKLGTLTTSEFRREFPACLEDAFHLDQNTYFHPTALEKIKEVISEDKDRVLEEPKQHDIYAMGVDVGGGVGGDYSTICVVSMATKQPVYFWRDNKITPSSFAEKVMEVANWYNSAKVLCESNNHGHVVLFRLKYFNYENLWYNEETGADWVTTTKSKLDAYETLRIYVNDGIIEMCDATALSELGALVIKRVTPEAANGHDDMADAMALAYRCTRDISSLEVTQRQRSVMDVLLSEIKSNRSRMGIMRNRAR